MERIRDLDLEQREKTIAKTPFIAEHVEINGELISTDFTLRRMTGGPGLAARGAQTQDFQFNPNEGFGEQTSVVWSKSGFAAVQYNHRGARISRIAKYVEAFLSGGKNRRITVTPYVDPDVWARFAASDSHIGMECTIDARPLTSQMAESNIPLEQALRMRQETGTGKLKFKLFYGEDRPGGRVNLFEMVQGLWQHRECVESLKVKVREDADAASELLNLFGHQDSDNILEQDLAQSAGRRFTRESRLRQIRSVFETWLQDH